MSARRFPPPWSIDGPDTKLGQDCFIVRDANGQALAYVYFEDRRTTAHSPAIGRLGRLLPLQLPTSGVAARSAYQYGS
jgi:hypothetical protein